MNHLYKALLEDERIRRRTLAWRREELLKAGYGPRTINLFLLVANTYLEFVGFREHQLAEQLTVGWDNDL